MNNPPSKRALLLLMPFIGLVAGCTSLGQASFDCPHTEVGAACISARQVYEKTHTTDRIAPAFKEGKRIDPSTAQADPTQATPDQHASYRPPLPEMDAPLPVRTPAKVMRIRIFPWEDNARDLHTGGFVYTEVEGRAWTIGEEQVSRVQAQVINPLTAPSKPQAPSASLPSLVNQPAPPPTSQKPQPPK